MCGIAGYIQKNNARYPTGTIENLLAPIRARGPDDEGVCLISRHGKKIYTFKTDKTVSSLSDSLKNIYGVGQRPEHDVAFIHSRFAILDLSDKGHQPFLSQDGFVVLVFNGEIYNFIELRQELETLGVQFKTSCDTEVLVEGYCQWREELWSRLNGFWAVALYDKEKDEIVFSRDRVGVAPLYYRETADGLYFSSYIQSLINVDPKHLDLNQDVILGFIQTSIKDHDETTYYKQIKSVPFASTVTFRERMHHMAHAKIVKYWHLPEKRLSENDISFDETVNKYREVFFRAVELRLRADVKVAFELSGGLDSSSIVAAASMINKDRITTYTAKVKEADEEPYARSMLNRYDIDYKVIEHIEGDFVGEFAQFMHVMEEPYDNPNAYTHHRMLQIMKSEGVDVVVTGAGGDEVLAGYESSFWPAAYRELRRGGFPAFLKADWYEFCRRFKTWKMSGKTLRHYIVDTLNRLQPLATKSPQGSLGQIQTNGSQHFDRYENLSFHQRSHYHFKTAQVPYYMRSSDHFTMGIPVEHRFPFLDYRMIEFGLQLPTTYLFKGGWTKYILRKAMEEYLPKQIIWRREKMGFKFPYKYYLNLHKTTFKPYLEESSHIDLLDEPHLSYVKIMEQDPKLLWRYLVTGIWIKHVLKENNLL